MSKYLELKKRMFLTTLEEPDDAWWSGKLYTQATDKVGGYVATDTRWININTGNWGGTIALYTTYFLKIPRGVTTLTIDSKQTTYYMGADGRMGIGFFSDDLSIVQDVGTTTLFRENKVFNINNHYKYVGVSVRNNISSIRNNTTFEFSK